MVRSVVCFFYVVFAMVFSSLAETKCFVVRDLSTKKIQFLTTWPDSITNVEIIGKSENCPADFIEELKGVKTDELNEKFATAFLIRFYNTKSPYESARIEVGDKDYYSGNIFQISHTYPLLAYYIHFNGKRWVCDPVEESTIAVEPRKESLIKLWFVVIFFFYLITGIKKGFYYSHYKCDRWYEKAMEIGIYTVISSFCYFTINYTFDSLADVVAFLTVLISTTLLVFFRKSAFSAIFLNAIPAFFVWKMLGTDDMMVFLGISLVVSLLALLSHNFIIKAFKNRRQKTITD